MRCRINSSRQLDINCLTIINQPEITPLTVKSLIAAFVVLKLAAIGYLLWLYYGNTEAAR